MFAPPKTDKWDMISAWALIIGWFSIIVGVNLVSPLAGMLLGLLTLGLLVITMFGLISAFSSGV